VDEWDHAFLAFSGDTAIVDFLNNLPGHKTVILDCVPRLRIWLVLPSIALIVFIATPTVTICNFSNLDSTKRLIVGLMLGAGQKLSEALSVQAKLSMCMNHRRRENMSRIL
jgi:hypothetical protein